MAKTMNYKTAKGTEITVAVDYSKVGNGFTQDGYTVKSTKVDTVFDVRFIIDGNIVASGYGMDYCNEFDNSRFPNHKFVCGRLLITAEQKKAIDEFLEQVVAEYETPAELAELERLNNENSKAIKIASAKKVLARAKNEKVYSVEEAAKKAAEYNNLYNEGGEGFVPNYLTFEQIEKAKEVLNND
jgi:hypothetical protein